MSYYQVVASSSKTSKQQHYATEDKENCFQQKDQDVSPRKEITVRDFSKLLAKNSNMRR
jgi:hypothetical protein